MNFRKKKHPQISLDETFESVEEVREPCVEFGVPDLNMNGVIDRINLVSGCKKMLVLHDIQGYEDLADFGLHCMQFQIPAAQGPRVPLATVAKELSQRRAKIYALLSES